ncbi:MAG TPA: cyclopropane-fatty-acyl-phospholipid synthase family protein [Stellaceae bacterium]|nr:cyclopropane-fatty-acyl-phospholipid synthase family protein [Stellaceae bacterium]
MLLARLFERLITIGRLRLVDAAGRVHLFTGAAPGPEVAIRLSDPALHGKLVLRPRLYVPEAYMDGTLTIEEGSLYDLVDLLAANVEALPDGVLGRLLNGTTKALRRVHQYNPVSRAERNAAHHYDLSGELYDLFLDRDRQYSCGYFRGPETDIDTAQFDKKRHIAAKLLLRPGHKVLDIGSGWGGLALYLAAECGADVTGLTLSAEQHKVATRRAAAAGLGERVRFHLRDYREERGEYDRIVSVGMFEHVGINHYGAFFAKLKALLKPDGVALLHAIGRMDGPGSTHPWIRKYIFPGGYCPALSEVVPVVERARLWITDIEILRLHYARTLRAWRRRFEENRERVRAIYDERFCRMWEMYLVGSEIAFRRGNHLVFQMQIAKAVDTVPLVRDYMVDWERAHEKAAEEAA